MTMAENLKFSKHKEIKGKAAYDRYDNYDAIEVPLHRRDPQRLRRHHGRADHLPRQVQPRPVRDSGIQAITTCDENSEDAGSAKQFGELRTKLTARRIKAGRPTAGLLS